MRYHTTSEGNIPFTPEEETARDVEEAQAAVDMAANDAIEVIKGVQAHRHRDTRRNVFGH